MLDTYPLKHDSVHPIGEYPIGEHAEAFDMNSQACLPEDIGLPSTFESGAIPQVVATITIEGIDETRLGTAIVKMKQPDGSEFTVLWGMMEGDDGGFRAREGSDAWQYLTPEAPTLLGRARDIWGGGEKLDVSREHAAVMLEGDEVSIAHVSKTLGTKTTAWGAKITEPTKDSEYELSLTEVTSAFEKQGFMKDAPRFIEQAVDPESDRQRRENMISHNYRDANGNSSIIRSSEATELTKLKKVLTDVRSKLESRAQTQGATEALTALTKAAEEFDELAFIGKAELDEAVDGIADYWIDTLRSDPEATITVLAAARQDMGGSFGYMYRRVVESVNSREELGEHEKRDLLGRIRFCKKFSSSMLREEKAKFMFLDDWSISERSLKNHSLSVLDDIPETDQSELLNRSEVNLVFAFPEQIQDGIKLGDVEQPVPVKGYFKARHGYFEKKVHVTGAHASVDYGFEEPLRSLISDVYGATKSSDLLSPNGSRMPSAWWRGAYSAKPVIPQLLLFDSQRAYTSHRNH